LKERLAAVLFAGVVLMLAQTCASAQAPPADPISANLTTSSAYQPITGEERFKWFAVSTMGPQSLTAGVFSAAIGTAENKPKEYGPSWEGFGKRYGMRLTGISTGNAMEAGLGALWGEDPRYLRAVGEPFGSRVRNVVKMTFLASRRTGRLGPAYARFIAIPGNNFLSNTWRADSEATARDAALRTLLGVLGRMGSNAFQEFWPDVRQHLFHKKP
jgi:hypothetical protein